MYISSPITFFINERNKTMWYVKLNGTILPTPYLHYSDCFDACNRLKEEMIAVCTEPVFIE